VRLDRGTAPGVATVSPSVNIQLASAQEVLPNPDAKGLENAPDALNLLFTGGNTGKVIVKV
jgi:NADPH-dependent curcumin reductase CurA